MKGKTIKKEKNPRLSIAAGDEVVATLHIAAGGQSAGLTVSLPRYKKSSVNREKSIKLESHSRQKSDLDSLFTECSGNQLAPHKNRLQVRRLSDYLQKKERKYPS